MDAIGGPPPPQPTLTGTPRARQIAPRSAVFNRTLQTPRSLHTRRVGLKSLFCFYESLPATFDRNFALCALEKELWFKLTRASDILTDLNVASFDAIIGSFLISLDVADSPSNRLPSDDPLADWMPYHPNVPFPATFPIPAPDCCDGTLGGRSLRA